VARACELVTDNELTGVYNVGTEGAYSYNEMVAMINDALGTDVDPEYIECLFDGYVHDTMADYSNSTRPPAGNPRSALRRASNASVRPTARLTLP
jgi:UDP-glucose 4-epimerase